MQMVKIGGVSVSRLILGSNPFSGFSHQGREVDLRMKRYYTTARIKQTLRDAEGLGINTVVARTDHHVMRFLLEYWDEGGKIQWFAQTCPGVGPTKMCVDRAVAGGAKACHIHGGVMDNFVAQKTLDEVAPAIEMIQKAGLLAGIAGHNVRVFEWAEKNLDCDYYLCCYYNPTPRDDRPEHVHGAVERYAEEDRRAMVEMIAKIKRPVIHYKVMAAGRNNPADALACAAGHMRKNDAVCVGVFTQERSDMLAQDAMLLEKALKEAKKPAAARRSPCA
jgi:hypothetical protein